MFSLSSSVIKSITSIGSFLIFTLSSSVIKSIASIGSFLIFTLVLHLEAGRIASQQLQQLFLGRNSGKEEIRFRNDLFSFFNFLFLFNNFFTAGSSIMASKLSLYVFIFVNIQYKIDYYYKSIL